MFNEVSIVWVVHRSAPLWGDCTQLCQDWLGMDGLYTRYDRLN